MTGEVRNLFHRFVRRHSESCDHSEAVSCVAIDSNEGGEGFGDTTCVCVCVCVCVCEVLFYTMRKEFSIGACL